MIRSKQPLRPEAGWTDDDMLEQGGLNEGYERFGYHRQTREVELLVLEEKRAVQRAFKAIAR